MHFLLPLHSQRNGSIEDTRKGNSEINKAVNESMPSIAMSPHNRLLEEATGASGGNWNLLDWQEVAREEIAKGSEAVNRLVGSEDTVHTAIEGLAFHVYKMDAFPPGSLDERGRSFADRIPGTVISSAKEVSQFRAWQEGVAVGGAWVNDPTPRRLGWNSFKSYETCDKRHVEEGGIADEEADRVADEWEVYKSRHRGEENNPEFLSTKRKTEGRWRVREALKYTWRPTNGSLPWASLDGPALCSLAREKQEGGRSLDLLVLGDSLQNELSTAMENAFVLTHPNEWSLLPVEQCGHLTEFEVHHYCSNHVSPAGSVCTNASLNVVYVRNFFLHLSSHRLSPHFMRWSRMRGIIKRADAIIVNRGSHVSPDIDFRQGMRALFRYLRVVAPDTLIIARSTHPGHMDCMNFTKPLEAPIPLGANAPYHWLSILPQNPIVKEEAHAIGGVFVDVAPMTALRADSHMGRKDCLHYCIPGPIDGWVQLILNNLMRLMTKHD